MQVTMCIPAADHSKVRPQSRFGLAQTLVWGPQQRSATHLFCLARHYTAQIGQT